MELTAIVDLGRETPKDGHYVRVDAIEGNPHRFFVRISTRPEQPPAVKHRKIKPLRKRN